MELLVPCGGTDSSIGRNY